ncbi:hypothetical protein RVIR1_00880 [Candidatus Rickettsiella viridis]|uniref:Uncharacterized protein n=1 Tax=Candidatus Rickettsiella viridis TaxID=676208 RepID=A0A2Z5UUK8_9COXI|nr:hypothetical protein [Candidatus Rickettsiella viridis]BBB14630.1 hypothetical protein RVIR1_00880 [Candidatus Rickettsiella viridis]
MIEIKNGVIKNIDKLSPESQKYLKELTEDLKLDNKPNQFNIGFLYTYNVRADEKWGDAKEKFKDIKEALKKKFRAIKDVCTKKRQEMEISEVVTRIKDRVLTKIKAKEKKHLESCQSTFNRRRTLANFLKKLTIGIFGTTFFALATTALITNGYISLPVIMPIIMPVVTLAMANPIIVGAALVAIMSTLFLTSWKAVSSKRNAKHALDEAEKQTNGNIDSLDRAMDQSITPTKSPSYTGPAPLQTTHAPTFVVGNRKQNNPPPHNGEDVVDNQGPNDPFYYTLNPLNR